MNDMRTLRAGEAGGGGVEIHDRDVPEFYKKSFTVDCRIPAAGLDAVLAAWGVVLARAAGLPEAVIRTGCGLRRVRLSPDATLDGLIETVADGECAASFRFEDEPALPEALMLVADMQGCGLRVSFDPARVDMQVAADHARWLGVLLNAAANDATLADLPMLPAPERADVLRLAGQGFPDAPRFLSRFAAHVRAQPDALAVRAGDVCVSYAELDCMSDRIAGGLAARGLAAGAIVGLCLDRSVDHVAAMLGVLKAGAAFLPLDPAYPEAALAHMVTDSRAALVITRKPAAWMPAAAAPEDLAGSAPPPPIGARTAYVIYTSGTTGKPKGVAVPCSALDAHVAAAALLFGLTPRDRVLQFTSLSFDVSVEEIVPTLGAGAAVVLRANDAIPEPRDVLRLCAAAGVTVMNLPTAWWQTLAEDGTDLPAAIRLVIAGGERVPPAAFRRWRARYPDVRWINGYGPTEATITCAAYEATTDVPQGEVPVGAALSHARLYVLGADRSLLPEGVEGELWIGGACVAEGYLNRPEQTAERFLPDPFHAGGRMYRSGDLARWDGGILHLGGRADRQIKLRGYRIEPAEVERVLESLAGVSQALVAGLEGRLVAWLRLEGGTSLEALRMTASLRLPPQMLPLLIPVADWPMKPGGKIDMARLPRPDAPAAVAAASDPLTQAICEIFAELLRRPAVGPDQSLLDLGGHSLLVLRLIARIEAQMGVRLPLPEVYAEPTPRALATLLANGAKGDRFADCLVRVQPDGSRPPIFAIHVLGPDACYFRPLAEALGTDQPLLGLTTGLIPEGASMTVEAAAEVYFDLIARIQPVGPVRLVAMSLGAYYALELAQMLRASGREVALLAMLDSAGPGGRARKPLVQRLLTHVAITRRDGWAHPAHLLFRTAEEIGHRAAHLRQRLRPGRNDSSGDFVAANEIAVAAYAPAPYAGRITVVRAGESIFDTPEAIASGLGWGQIARGGLDLAEVPGHHLSMMDAPNVAQLAAILCQGTVTQS